jgi:hypothetical protein
VNRYMLTQPYITAIEDTLADRVDHGMLIKVHAQPREDELRHSPADVCRSSPNTAGRLLVGPPRRKRIVTAGAVYCKRLWLCPECGARRLKLYLPGRSSRLWACRVCWNLGYSCQLEPWSMKWEMRRRRVVFRRK